MTRHKVQGMTLDSIVVDCSSVCRPGQLGVAFGCAMTLQCLQVVGFKDRCIMQLDVKVKTFSFSTSKPFPPNMSCCRSAIVDEHVRPACDDLDTDDNIYKNDEEDHDDKYGRYNDIQQSPI